MFVCVQEHWCLMHVRGGGVRGGCNRSLSVSFSLSLSLTHTHTHIEAIFKNFRILSYQEVFCHVAKNTS